MTLDFRYPTPLPSTKGWGPGWPNCQSEKMVPVKPFFGGFRAEIAPLLTMLVAEMRARGFDFMTPGCWGFGCRSTKSSAGPNTATPSFHSWGLAPDINAPRNVYGAPEATSEIATKERWVVPLMAAYGFYWLGPAIKDWMHFSFVGSPKDAADLTAKARKELGMGDYIEGIDKFWAAFGAANGDPGPPPQGLSPLARKGWGHARKGASNPKPGTPGPHDHNLIGKAE